MNNEHFLQMKTKEGSHCFKEVFKKKLSESEKKEKEKEEMSVQH